LSFDYESPDAVVNSIIKAITADRLYIYHGGYEYVGDDYRKVSEITCISIEKGEEGTIIGVIDLSSIFSEEDCIVDNVDGIYENNGQTYIVLTLQYSDYRGRKTYLANMDYENKEISDLQLIDIASTDNSAFVSVNNVVFLNGKVFLECYEGNSDYSVYVYDGDKVDRIPLEDVDFVGDISISNEDNIILSVTRFGRETELLLNTDSYQLSETNELSDTYSIKSSNLIKSDGNGEEHILLDFNNTDLSYSLYSNARIVSVEDERIIISPGVFDTDFVVLNKSDSNPNAGKQIIKAAYIEQVTAVEAEGIRRYNNEDNSYYIVISDTYNFWNYFDQLISEDDYDLELIRSRSAAINQLMADIRSGEGPDIVLGGAEYCELHNNQYLVDLSSYISGLNLSEEDYLANAFNASEENGAYYFLPIDVCLQGLTIRTDSGYSEDGIEFHNYPDFVRDYCDGNDPLYVVQDRITYFNILVSSSLDLYNDSDGRISFDNSEFRELASYLYDNIPEMIIFNKSRVTYSVLQGFAADYMMYGPSLAEIKLIGLPSCDGRSASYIASSAVSITTCSSCCDGGQELIQELLSDDVQEYSDHIPVNKAALIECINEYDSDDLIDQHVIDNYVDMINSGDHYYSTYYTITRILSEEIQAYLKGQKNLDDVIEIIDNRVSLLIGESE